MPQEELSFKISLEDAASAGVEKIGKVTADQALKIEQANVKVLKSQKNLQDAQDKYGKDSLQARDAAVKLAAANRSLSKSYEDVSDSADKADEDVSGIGDTLKKTVGVAAGVGIGAAIAKNLDIEQGRAKLAAQLGATTDDAERYGKIAGSLYSQNFGENMDQVNEAIRNVTQNIGKLGDDGANSLESVSADVLSLSQAFDVDLFEATRAVGTMLRTGVSKDAKSALDTITIGLQKVPGAADDLLDTFNEYSVQFKSLGLTADDALTFIASAMQGGARNTDLAADALKEFNLRAKDTTNVGAQSALKELGLAAEGTARQIAGGGDSAAAAMAQILQRLKDVPDPADRARIATELLGTQAEDLQGALFAVDPTALTTGLEGTAGAADKLSDTLGDTNAGKIESYKRQLEQLATNAAGLPGPLGAGAAGIVAFGAGALDGAANIAELSGGIGRIPGVAAKAEKALTLLKASSGTLATSAGVAAAAIAAVELGPKIGELGVATQSTDELATALDQLGQSGKLGKSGLDLFTNSGGFGLIHDEADDTSDALDRFGRQAERALGDGLSQKAGRALNFGKSVGQLKDTANQLDTAFASLVQNGHIDQAAQAQEKFIQAGKDAGVPVDKLTALFPKYNAAVSDAEAKQRAAAAAAQVMGSDLKGAGTAAANAAVSQEDLNKATQDYVSQTLKARGSARDFEAAIDNVSQSIKSNGKSLDITTEKGRANQQALDDIADAGIALANNVPEGVNAQKHFQESISRTRTALIDAARQMGLSRTAARKLADQILGVPSKKNIKATDNFNDVKRRAQNAQGYINGMHGKNISIGYSFYQIGKGPGTPGQGLGVLAKAAGGPIYGPGTKTSDSIPTWLSTGEQVWSAADVERVGGMAAAERLRKGDVPSAGGRPAPVAAARPGGGGGGAMVLEIASSGSRVDDLLVEILRRSVRVRGGGNVQVALGRN